jgi:selenocysteine-specific elongation factor
MVRLKPWSHVIFHTGTFYTKARMHLLTADSLSGKESSVVQIHLENPAILLKNDKFIIRNSSNDLTLGGGTILDTQPLHHRRRTEKLKNKMQVLADAMINQANRFQLLMFEMEKEGKPVLLSELSERVSMPVADILKACNENQGKLIHIEVDNEAYLFSESYQNSISNRIIKEISDFHTQNKLVEKGLDIKELNSKLAISSAAELEILGIFLENLVKEEKLKTVDKSYALKSHRVKPDKKMQEQIDWINYATGNRGFQRIIVSELATKAQHEGIKKGQLIALLKFLSGRNELFFNGEDIIHSSVLNPARTKLLRHLLEKPMGINEKEFRLLLDAPKKTSQVLIDIFLKEGIISKETFYLHITETGKKSI